MNDNELGTAVRESVADVHTSTPVDQIISRGHAVRARRRIPAATGALAVAGGAAVAIATLTAPGHSAPLSPGQSSGQPGRQPAVVRLAAWTVARQANGDIEVTIKQLQDPEQLQATLRADGLPVTVSFSGAPFSAACRPYSTSLGKLHRVAHFRTSDGSDFLTINPSALPAGVGMAIFDEPGKGLPPHPRGATANSGNTSLRGSIHPPAGMTGPLAVGLVYASPQCTG